MELATYATWKALLQGWRRPAQQHDVTELMSFVMDQNSPLVAGEWQARCEEPGRDIIWDRGSTSPFISLDIQGKHSLREALISWHEQHYRHAFAAAPILLAIQLGRFRHNGRRTVKIRPPCDIPPALELPFFRDNQLEYGRKSYRLCCGIVHIGDLATSGRYRPFCVHRAVYRFDPRSPHPTIPKTRLGPIPYMTMTGLPCPGVLVRIVCYVTILILSSTCVVEVLTGIEVSRAFRGAPPFHLSCGVASGNRRALRGMIPGRHCYRQPLCLPA